MAGYNRVIIIGNLTKDPELRPVGAQSVCKLTIASNRQYKNRQTGNTTQEVCFIDVEVWGVQADSCKLYLAKGRPVLVEGRLKLDSWKDAEGNTKSKHGIVAERVIFLNSNAESQSNSEEASDFADNSSLSNTNEGFNAKKFEGATKESRGSRKKAESDVSFKDTPPFAEDELPF